MISLSNPDGVAAPIGSYSHLAVVPSGTDLLFLAGQIGMTREGDLPSSPEEQFNQALRNVVTILESEGCGPRDIVRLNTYLVKPLEIDQLRTFRVDLLDGAQPPSTLIYVPRLASEEILVEVEATAVRKKGLL
jgi:2-iminobutanoate/2-iminopropanoate deaminase